MNKILFNETNTGFTQAWGSCLCGGFLDVKLRNLNAVTVLVLVEDVFQLNPRIVCVPVEAPLQTVTDRIVS